MAITAAKNPPTLKQLQTQLATLKRESASAKERQREVQSLIQDLARQIQSVEKSIDTLTKLGPVVSEHAILRYLERVKGINIDDVRAEILPESVKATVCELGNGQYPVGNFKIRVRDGVVITVITADRGDNSGW